MDSRPQSRSSVIHVSIGLIMLFQVSALFVRSVIEVKMVENGIDQTTAKYAGASIGFVALGIFLAPVLHTIGPRLMLQYTRPASWARLISASVALGLLLWIANSQALLVYSTLDWIGSADQSRAAEPIYTFACSDAMILLLAIPVMSVLTPVVEETINRGLILQTLLPTGRWRGILISSILFSILHKPETYPTAFFFGLFAAVQVLNWRSLWGPIITHGTFNFLVELDRTCLNAYWLPGRIQLETGGALQTSFAVFLLCLSASCWLVSARRLGAT